MGRKQETGQKLANIVSEMQLHSSPGWGSLVEDALADVLASDPTSATLSAFCGLLLCAAGAAAGADPTVSEERIQRQVRWVIHQHIREHRDAGRTVTG